ncbi:MAG: hypothetical protein FVQ81_06795 [Candidatus Glassbacteria bacterium]|nr:hypothetical protein [Candidatus Glassbacteria bacterium]
MDGKKLPVSLIRALLVLAFFMIAVTPATAAVAVSVDGDLTVLDNGSLAVAVSGRDGTIRRLVNLEDGVDYCNQIAAVVWPVEDVPVGERIGGVLIYDELKQKAYSDLNDPGTISGFKVEEGDGRAVITFEKSFPGADFVVAERMELHADHLRWTIKAVKQSGEDRSLKMVQLLPLPTWGYSAWAPIAEAPFSPNPWEPFQVNYGIVDGGPVGNTNWRTVIPMLTFYRSDEKNALTVVNPFEIPAVRIRYRNSIGISQDFHWNSRNYAMDERPYLQVISEYLGLRDTFSPETGLLITLQPANWRASLGWVYEQYREYFDPAPGFERYDGAYVIDQPYPDAMSGDEFSEQFKGYYDEGVRWEEMHGHFTKYGEMIPPVSVKTWENLSHPRPGRTKSRERIRDHSKRAAEQGVGTFIYYNITESEWWYARDKYPDDIALDENGVPIPAYKGQTHPDSNACWLMCSDPNTTSFGRDLAEQAREMVRSYPDIAGFFWDVYGRTYKFDFAHDDGMTMVNNKPAYFPMNMFTRMMREVVGPVLHENGKFITCNKPTMITALKGIDGVMARESTPAVEKPDWLIAQSYLGLNRHGMILDSGSWQHPERLFLNCLRYGYFYSRVRSGIEPDDSPEVVQQKKKAEWLQTVYHPLIEKFKGKKWVFHPRALSLPPKTDGNIFRLADGSVMVAMVSIWRDLYNIPGTTPDVELTCRLPDAAEFTTFSLVQPDITGSSTGKPVSPSKVEGDALTFRLEQHGLASVILLEK